MHLAMFRDGGKIQDHVSCSTSTSQTCNTLLIVCENNSSAPDLSMAFH